MSSSCVYCQFGNSPHCQYHNSRCERHRRRYVQRRELISGPIVTFIDTLPNKQADLLKGQAGGGQGWSLDLSPLVANGPGKVVLVTEVTIQ
jgi:hypothetical protein